MTRRNITKEDYELVIAHNPYGYICDKEIKKKFFTDSAIYGYGIKYARVFEEDGNYYLDSELFSSCD